MKHIDLIMEENTFILLYFWGTELKKNMKEDQIFFNTIGKSFVLAPVWVTFSVLIICFLTEDELLV